MKKIIECLFWWILAAVPFTLLGLFNTLFKMYLYEK